MGTLFDAIFSNSGTPVLFGNLADRARGTYVAANGDRGDPIALIKGEQRDDFEPSPTGDIKIVVATWYAQVADIPDPHIRGRLEIGTDVWKVREVSHTENMVGLECEIRVNQELVKTDYRED